MYLADAQDTRHTLKWLVQQAKTNGAAQKGMYGVDRCGLTHQWCKANVSPSLHQQTQGGSRS